LGKSCCANSATPFTQFRLKGSSMCPISQVIFYQSTNSEQSKNQQNQNILFNEKTSWNIIKHSLFSALGLFFAAFVFQLCRLHVLYSCCLNVLSPSSQKKKISQQKIVKKESIRGVIVIETNRKRNWKCC
jgi:hypothetical protein